MASKKLTRNATQTAAFKRYAIENRYDKNRLAALIKHAKKHPGDMVGMAALRMAELGKLVYRRNFGSKGHAKPAQKKFKLFPQDNRANLSIAEQLTKLLFDMGKREVQTCKHNHNT